MKVKHYLRTAERRTFEEQSTVASMDSFSGLNCRGGTDFGVPKRVVQFAEQYDWASSLWQLGDVKGEGLRQEICNFWSDYAELTPKHIKIGYGSMKILERISSIFIEHGTKVLGCAPQFYGYVIDIIMSGANYKTVPLNPKDNFRFNPDSLLTEIEPDCCLVYIDNPHNPTGQLISLNHIEEIVKEAKRKDVAVLVDEAYADYVGKENSAIGLVNRYDNLMVTRTFTKGYQFAGIRVGYGIFSPEIGAYYDKIDHPLAIPGVGSALAKEALLDQEFIPALRQRVKSVKDDLIKGLKERDYLIAETHEACPIILLSHKNPDVDLWRDLFNKAILTLSPGGFMNLGKNSVRVNIPTKAEDFLSRL